MALNDGDGTAANEKKMWCRRKYTYNVFHCIEYNKMVTYAKMFRNVIVIEMVE